MFNEASVAKERRIFRANKVRKNREKNRICLLQELFNNEINKIDPLFFNRLDASSYWQDDKKISNNQLITLDSIFADLNFNDKKYYSNFKTIYHLRNACLKEENYLNGLIPDIRFVYLACHHIIKKSWALFI